MRFDAMECGKRIKALREEKRLTQMELAEQICITTDHLRAIERTRAESLFHRLAGGFVSIF